MKKNKTEILALAIILIGMIMIAVPIITKYMTNDEENSTPSEVDKKDNEPRKDNKDVCDVSDTRISIERLHWPDSINVGDVLKIKATIEGLNENCEKEIIWKYQEMGDNNWIDIDPINDNNYEVSEDQLTLSIIASEITIGRSYYAVLDYK